MSVFKYVPPTSPHLTLPAHAWFVDKAVHDMSVDPQERPSKQSPSRGQKQQRLMKRPVSETGLDGVTHAPRLSRPNIEFQEFHLAAKAGIDMSEETAKFTPAHIEHSHLEVENEGTLLGRLNDDGVTADDSQPPLDDTFNDDGASAEEALLMNDAVGADNVDTPAVDTASARARRSHRAPARYGE